jgi:hypothetical protein
MTILTSGLDGDLNFRILGLEVPNFKFGILEFWNFGIWNFKFGSTSLEF